MQSATREYQKYDAILMSPLNVSLQSVEHSAGSELLSDRVVVSCNRTCKSLRSDDMHFRGSIFFQTEVHIQTYVSSDKILGETSRHVFLLA